ncbi:MAG: hypothetical protein ABSF15_13630 [Candidatus Sulfotelmatobacter sp.]|jgi:hypothetical protein
MENKPKRKKVWRVRNPASQIQELLDTGFAALMQDKSLKASKAADLAMARLSCLQSLLLIKSEEAKARLKHSDVDALMKENAELRAQLGKTTAQPTPKESDVVARFRTDISKL